MNSMQPMNNMQQHRQSSGRIDPAQIPGPIAVQQADQTHWDQQRQFLTLSRALPPLASSDFLCIDTGNASPRFVRSTTYSVPATHEIAQNANIPIALIVQPMAEVRSNEAAVPVVDFGPTGPVRCRRCQAYINPFVKWLDGGAKFQCNICQFANTVEGPYFANLGMTGQRVDIDQRPELRLGTVDFVATKEFCLRDPKPASWVFLLDVSMGAVQSGMLKVACETLKEMMDLFPEDDDGNCPCRIGIVTYDKTVHFYNLSVLIF